VTAAMNGKGKPFLLVKEFSEPGLAVENFVPEDQGESGELV
jgi:hypothetical protein